jgi:hypothetical protein
MFKKLFRPSRRQVEPIPGSQLSEIEIALAEVAQTRSDITETVAAMQMVTGESDADFERWESDLS